MTDIRYPDFSDAACRGIGVEMFFPIERDGDTDNAVAYADTDGIVKVCNSCPIVDECATWALHRERYGIWGGMTPRQRDILRKKLNIKLVDPMYIDAVGR